MCSLYQIFANEIGENISSFNMDIQKTLSDEHCNPNAHVNIYEVVNADGHSEWRANIQARLDPLGCSNARFINETKTYLDYENTSSIIFIPWLVKRYERDGRQTFFYSDHIRIYPRDHIMVNGFDESILNIEILYKPGQGWEAYNRLEEEFSTQVGRKVLESGLLTNTGQSLHLEFIIQLNYKKKHFKLARDMKVVGSQRKKKSRKGRKKSRKKTRQSRSTA